MTLPELDKLEQLEAAITKLTKKCDMYHAEATRQMKYGIKQHECAQDALRERDAVRAELAEARNTIAQLRFHLNPLQRDENGP